MLVILTMALAHNITKKIGKRGLSPIVATIALVLVTIAAASLIAGIIVPLVRDRLNEGTECIGYENYFSFYEGFDYNCYRQSDGNYLYAISVQADNAAQDKIDNVEGMRMQFVGGGESDGVDIEEGAATAQIRMLNSSQDLSIPKKGGVKTYVYTSSRFYKNIELAPILENGHVCTKSDELNMGGFVCISTLDLDI
jgi:flagellin-like protein